MGGFTKIRPSSSYTRIADHVSEVFNTTEAEKKYKSSYVPCKNYLTAAAFDYN
jgi:hypothetical protein